MGMIADELEQLQPQAFANGQLRPRQHGRVFLEKGFGDVEAGGFGNGEEESGALEAVGLDGG
jgi:hypothetical protein